MRFIVRWVMRLVFLLIVLLVAAILLKDLLIKSWLEKSWRSQTGVDVRIQGFELNLMNPVIHFQDFVFYNSEEFGGSPGIQMDEMYVEYYPNELVWGKMHYKLVRLNIREIHIVQTPGGKNNLSQIQAAIQKGLIKTIPGFKFVGIDTLNLSVGKIKFTLLGKKQSTREATIGLQNEIIKDIRSADTIWSIISKFIWQKGLGLIKMN